MAQKLGIRAIHKLAKKLCLLFATFTPVAKAIIPQDKHVYWDALNQACSDFVLNIDPAIYYNDEVHDGILD